MFALTATIAFAGAADASAACPGESTLAALQAEATLEQTVVCLVNERRAEAGLAPVADSSKLRAAGYRHSTEMVSSGFFAHTTPSGVSFIDRILDTGYTSGTKSWLVGENLAWGTGRLSSPAALVKSWMDSPPHRENLLRPQFREIGIAAVRGTPQSALDVAGITVSSEYGVRVARSKAGKSSKKATKRSKRKQARRAKARRRAAAA